MSHSFRGYGKWFILAAAGLLMLPGCVKSHVIKDPSNEAHWGYYGKSDKNGGIVLMNRRDEPLTPDEKDKRYVATTGFIEGVAFVASCTERDKKKKNCLSTQIALIDEDGHKLNSFGDYEYPELEVSLEYPAMILYVTHDGKKLHFPMFDAIKNIETDGIQTALFKDDFFLIKRYGAFGYIDKSGRDMISARYSAATQFHDGKAYVVGDKGLGVLDTKGEYVPEKYACMTPFSDTLRLVNLGGSLLDFNQDMRTQLDFYMTDEFKGKIKGNEGGAFCDGGKWGLIDQQDSVVIPEKYTSIVVQDSTGYLFVSDEENHVVGYYQIDGKPVIEAKYKSVSLGTNFNVVQNEEGLYAVTDKSGNELTAFDYDLYQSKGQPDNTGIYLTSEYVALHQKDGKWGLLSAYGMVVIPFDYDELGPESEGLISFRRGNRWGVVDVNNKEILAPIYKSVGIFEDGRAPAVLADDEIYVYRDQMTRQAWLEKERLQKERVEEADREATRESLRRQEALAAKTLEEQRRANAIQLRSERSRLVEDLNFVQNQIDVLEPRANLGVQQAIEDLEVLRSQRSELQRKIAEIDSLSPATPSRPVPPPPHPVPAPVMPAPSPAPAPVYQEQSLVPAP